MAAAGLSSLEARTQGSGVGQRPVSPEASLGPVLTSCVHSPNPDPVWLLELKVSLPHLCSIQPLSQSTRASMCPSDRDSSPLNKPSSHPGFCPSIQTVVCPPSTRCLAVHHPALLATVHRPSIYLSIWLPPQPSTPCIFSWPPLAPSSLPQPRVTPLVLLCSHPLSGSSWMGWWEGSPGPGHPQCLWGLVKRGTSHIRVRKVWRKGGKFMEGPRAGVGPDLAACRASAFTSLWGP